MAKFCPHCGASLVGGNCDNTLCGGAKTIHWKDDEPISKSKPESRPLARRGYLVAFAGNALFVLLTFSAAYVWNVNESLAGQLAVFLALVSLVLGFLVGATLIAVDKQYPGTGFRLGNVLASRISNYGSVSIKREDVPLVVKTHSRSHLVKGSLV